MFYAQFVAPTIPNVVGQHPWVPSQEGFHILTSLLVLWVFLGLLLYGGGVIIFVVLRFLGRRVAMMQIMAVI
jgi:hypothetical protein